MSSNVKLGMCHGYISNINAGAFLYYYRPGVAVDRTGGGVEIPVPPSIGQ